MAITIGDLLDFNAVETTDILQGIIELPYVKPIAYVPGRTYSTEFEDIVKGLGQRGSQAIIRKLGKGTVKSGEGYCSKRFRFFSSRNSG